MKELKLSNKNLYAMVDDEDYHRLQSYKWSGTKTGIYRSYSIKANRRLYRKGKRTIGVSLASEVMQTQGVMFDHIDRNYLNNQKNNLRKANYSMNGMNKEKLAGCSSMFKGVFMSNKDGKWQAQIKLNSIKYHLGYFEKELDAAKAYNTKAIELFGEFACINCIC